MPRRKKRAHELTDEEAMKRLFPKEVRDKLKEIAHEARKNGDSKPHKWVVVPLVLLEYPNGYDGRRNSLRPRLSTLC